ncbi:MAG: hypothetical protein IKJ43_03510 [Bacilli bacterium]|nr:hypothetical protein [Bacilli bacterium]
MSIPLVIFIIALVLVVVFYKDVRAFVYFVVMTDIFLRLVTYLKINIIKDTAFSFLNAIPADVPDIIRSFDLGVVTEILIFVYVITYIVFEIFLVRLFVKRKF